MEISIAIHHEGGAKSSVMMHVPLKNSGAEEICLEALALPAWERMFPRLDRPNLLQSADYGDVLARMNYQRVRRFLILKNGREAGLAQILEASMLRGAVQGVIADRCPLWFEGFGSTEDFSAFMQAFSRLYPKRFGRRIRLIPEIEDSTSVRQILKNQGFVQKSPCYETLWLDVRKDETALRRGLVKNWRASLRRAEGSRVETVLGFDGRHFDWFIENYARDKAGRGYNGASVKLLSALGKEFLRGKNMLVASALLEGEPIAAIVIFIHGKGATYQAGFTSALGRENCAHHLLLWKTCVALRERGVYEFDLGGFNGRDAQGVAAFKRGMGGEIVRAAGLYC